MECIIPECIRDTEDEYCRKHHLAKDNIEKAFDDWKIAYGSKFTMQDYLERLSDDFEVGAGIWVVEVAEFLLAKQ